MSTTEAWRRATKILCIRLDSLGDVLMTTPAIRALKRSGAERRITLLTSPAGAQVAEMVPEIDQALVYAAPWMKATGPRPDARKEFALIESLRRAHFHAAVVFTVYSQNPLPSAFLCYLAGIPLRLAHCHENPYQLLSDWVADPEPSQLVRHEVRRQLDLVAQVGCRTNDERLSLRVPTAARERVGRLLAALRVKGRRWIVIHPGSTAASRRYPPEQFAEVARLLAQKKRYQVVFTGVAEETELVGRIRAAMRCESHSLCGRLNLGELAALLEAAPLLVSNNTGPVHVAAALGTPVVDLYALTNPQHTPWAVPHRVLSHEVSCKYCYKSVCPAGHHDCLRLVTPAEIVAAAEELLAQRIAARAA